MCGRKEKKVLVPCLIAAGLLIAPWGGVGLQGKARAAESTDPPVNITADTMEFFNDKNLVVFTGNAIAVRTDTTLSADRMEVTLEGEADNRGDGSIRTIVATGQVNFRQTVPETGIERFATGDKAVYDGKERVISLSGKPKVWEGKNVIVGDVMRFFLEEHRFLAEGKVGLTIFPEKGKDTE